MQHEFTAFPRGTEGRSASRRLRRSGRAPGIVYGGENTPQPIELDHNALIHALKSEAFHSSILTMKLDGSFRNEILHVDFQRVEENRRIHIKVPLHFTHAEDSPASKTTDAIISHVLTDLDVSCLPKDLPQFIEVDLSALAVGQSIHVSDLTLPPGVVAVARGPVSPVVATAVIPRVIAEVEEAPAAEEAAPAAEGAVVEEAKPGEKEEPAEKSEKGAEKTSERSSGKEKK